MSHLLAISIGPVQDFIAAARRTADLYAGSQILQELCKAAASVIPEEGLIFPSSHAADGANKILARVEGDPKQVSQKAETAARAKLWELWREALEALPGHQRGLIDEARAELQLDGFLEFYAAWVPFDGSDYPRRRKEVDRLLAGRKALREFAPSNQDDEGVPKSPLDPSRAAVINPREWKEVNVRLEDGAYKPLRIKPTETLDAVSLLKRIYGVQKSATVVDTRTMARRAKSSEAMPDERYGEDDDHIQEPQPYYALLVADGDRMGALIDQKETIEEHKKLSALLDDFARQAKRIVDVHHGFLIYSGGDDVLAMLPVNTVIACAKELSETFRHKVRGSLSAGVAIVHYREPLSISLQAARDAEKAAKNGGRNALAVALHTRGGAPLTVVRNWDDLHWDDLQKAYGAKVVSRGLAYELRELAMEWQKDMRIDYLQAEAKRIVQRKERKDLKLPELRSITDLKVFADQLVIARFLSGIELEGAEVVANG